VSVIDWTTTFRAAPSLAPPTEICACWHHGSLPAASDRATSSTDAELTRPFDEKSLLRALYMRTDDQAMPAIDTRS